jgi:hypothetical protein
MAGQVRPSRLHRPSASACALAVRWFAPASRSAHVRSASPHNPPPPLHPYKRRFGLSCDGAHSRARHSKSQCVRCGVCWCCVEMCVSCPTTSLHSLRVVHLLSIPPPTRQRVVNPKPDRCWCGGCHLPPTTSLCRFFRLSLDRFAVGSNPQSDSHVAFTPPNCSTVFFFSSHSTLHRISIAHYHFPFSTSPFSVRAGHEPGAPSVFAHGTALGHSHSFLCFISSALFFPLISSHFASARLSRLSSLSEFPFPLVIVCAVRGPL